MVPLTASFSSSTPRSRVCVSLRPRTSASSMTCGWRTSRSSAAARSGFEHAGSPTAMSVLVPASAERVREASEACPEASPFRARRAPGRLRRPSRKRGRHDGGPRTRWQHVSPGILRLLRRLLGHGLTLLEHPRLDQPLEDLEDLLDAPVPDRKGSHGPLHRLGHGIESVDQRLDLLMLRWGCRNDERAREIIGDHLPLVA